MSREDCTEMRLLVQADIDGELTPAEAARVAAHLPRCADCATLQTRLMSLSARVVAEAPYHPASAALHAAVQARIGAPARSAAVETGGIGRRWRRAARPFGAGLALAAGVALMLAARGGGLAEAVVFDHIRALQPGHLLDVASTDRHTVKPWFDGRLDFAPPVIDLREAGFPLTGGRLDYLAGRPVAALIYQRRQHVIDLFVWPDDRATAAPAAAGSVSGYNFRSWRRDGMMFWAVSDLAADELAAFARLLTAG